MYASKSHFLQSIHRHLFRRKDIITTQKVRFQLRQFQQEPQINRCRKLWLCPKSSICRIEPLSIILQCQPKTFSINFSIPAFSLSLQLPKSTLDLIQTYVAVQ